MPYPNDLIIDKARHGANVFFLGPQSENAALARRGFAAIVNHWIEWRTGLFRGGSENDADETQRHDDIVASRTALHKELLDLCDAFSAETPTYTPRYFGHMVSEISLPALFGHFAALVHNPNNTSNEVSKVGARLEDEAIEMLARMVGFSPDEAEGHFTSGGTIANFEAIWRARYRIDHALALGLAVSEADDTRLDPFAAAHMGWRAFDDLALSRAIDEQTMRAASSVIGNPFDVAARISERSGHTYRGPVLITPASKHYSWRKSANIFGLGEEAFVDAPLDRSGRLDVTCLESLIEGARHDRRPILAIVSVAGTTEAGTIDPIDDICDLLDHYRRQGVHIWHHVDAAFGGFFTSTLGSESASVLPPNTIQALQAIRRADSVTLDPHKLGYVPYACGAFIVPSHRNYIASTFQAPYIERSAANDKWRGTIEGSRPATGAAGTWLTGRTIGYDGQIFGPMLAGTVRARQAFAEAIAAEGSLVRNLPVQDTNILCFSLAEHGDPLTISNLRTNLVFRAFEKDPNFAISKTVFSSASYQKLIEQHVSTYSGEIDSPDLHLLRCVFMNPFLSDRTERSRLLAEFVQRLKQHILNANEQMLSDSALE